MSTFVVSQPNEAPQTVDADAMFVDPHGYLCFVDLRPAPSLTHVFTRWTSASLSTVVPSAETDEPH